ncbi:SURF1 family protein [Neptuniibacter sp. QD37_6]|uniref:SURF1 family protein n=1 Tax=Neptuniibacter sp. QD37_6 TaxID=3398210 RepID=UPI0039F4B303
MSKVQSGSAFKWMLWISGIVLLPLLIGLGFWQLDRAEQKQELLDSWQQAIPSKALPLEQEMTRGSYNAVILKGVFDRERYFLLDNRVRKGRAGYEVVALFTADSGRNVLVNLGWVLASLNRGIKPEVVLPEGQQTISGSVRVIEKGFALSGDDLAEDQWPKVIQQLDVEKISSRLVTSIDALELRLTEPLLSGLDLNWPVENMKPEKHLGYAFQWFAMAFALLCLLIWSALKIRKEAIYEQV